MAGSGAERERSKKKGRFGIMKKSTFVAMILGTIGGILFALGMCMALIPEWNALNQGIIMGVTGAVVLLIMVVVWRKMEHKEPIKICYGYCHYWYDRDCLSIYYM